MTRALFDHAPDVATTCHAGLAPPSDFAQRLGSCAEWRLTCTEQQVGQDFPDRYGWFELVAPMGHFQSGKIRMTVGYWGAGLYYPWRYHDPEEPYTVVSGSDVSEAEDQPPPTLTAGNSCFHGASQPHALTTHESPILTFVLSRGEDRSGELRMSTS